MSNDAVDYENLSDEELMNAAVPDEGTADAVPATPEVQEETPSPAASDDAEPVAGADMDMSHALGREDDDTPSTLEEKIDAAAAAGSKDGENAADASDGETGSEKDHTTPNQTEAATDGSEDTDPADKGSVPAEDANANAADENAEGKAAAGDKTPDYEAAYNQIMAPFKANGREFTPQSPEEVIRLMQMGANYTKKMQALAPNLRMMRMLDKHELLSEEKLSFLIDLDKRDPAAIQKLIKDAEIDPMDLDTANASEYKPGNHQISDAEHQFYETLDSVAETQHGRETLAIMKEWDPASKRAVYEDPALMEVISSQKANGIYDTITAEISRQQTLGNLQNMPFLHAYKQVGDFLQSHGMLTPGGQSAAPAPASAQPEVLEVAPATKPSASNADKVRAAAPARSAPKSKPVSFDPINMSDEEIMALPIPR